MSASSYGNAGAVTKRTFGSEAHLAFLAGRRAFFSNMVDFTRGHGLEIGPLDTGIVDPERCDVSFVDVRDQAGTRAYFADDENVLVELIPEIAYPLTDEHGVVRTLDVAAAAGAPFDWVVASHVIEHVPDLIGWLRQVAALTADGGRLVLAVPDRRFTFDRHRPQTTVGQMLQAHEAGDTRPSTRAIYDYLSAKVPADVAGLWQNQPPAGFADREHTLPYAMEYVARGRDGEYVDAHVWTWTPQTFLEQLKELRALGLCDWLCERLQEPAPGMEFYAVLTRLPREGEWPEIAEPELRAPMPDWLYDEWQYRAAYAAEAARADLAEATARQLEVTIAEMRTELVGLRGTGRSETSTEPQIAVIIPTYDAEERILTGLDDLAAQTVPPELFEIVVVQNGPRNRTPHLVAEWAARHPRHRVRLIESDVASRQLARNLGLDGSTAPWVTFIDDDDRVQPRFLEALWDSAEAGHVSYGRVAVADAAVPQLVEEGLWLNQIPRSFLGRPASMPDLWPALCATWAKLAPREVIGQTRFDPSVEYGEDAVFWLEVMARSGAELKLTDFRAESAYVWMQRSGAVSKTAKDPWDIAVIDQLDNVQALQRAASAAGEDAPYAVEETCRRLSGPAWNAVTAHLRQHRESTPRVEEEIRRRGLQSVPWDRIHGRDGRMVFARPDDGRAMDRLLAARAPSVSWRRGRPGLLGVSSCQSPPPS